MQVIVLSPHRDDAAFSCGLLTLKLLQAGASITVVNVCTSSDYAPYLPFTENDRVSQVTSARATEDATYFATSQAVAGSMRGELKLLDCHWLDAPLRLAIPTEQVLRPTETTAAELDDLVVAFHVLPTADFILILLALGQHIDHLLVRDAAKQVFSCALIFYEDLPYACRMSKVERDRQRLVACPAGCMTWSPEPWAQSGIKQMLAECYPSQIDRSVAAEMEAYSAQCGNAEVFYGDALSLLALRAGLLGAGRA